MAALCVVDVLASVPLFRTSKYSNAWSWPMRCYLYRHMQVVDFAAGACPPFSATLSYLCVFDIACERPGRAVIPPSPLFTTLRVCCASVEPRPCTRVPPAPLHATAPIVLVLWGCGERVGRHGVWFAGNGSHFSAVL